MKKIININLSGRVIPIEDAAYEKLQGYIESLRRYFAREEGRDEIINDIESRIAELMNEKVRKGTEAITDADINEIMNAMGRPEDFEAETVEEASRTQQANQTGSTAEAETKKTRGRLYRDTSDKFLGGVCSGIANYLNVDPAIIRILFAIITFGGFGMGILIYILLWIVLPPKELEGYRGKRLYRNPEDRVIGGVAGGLAAYFNKEAWVIRLIFAAPLALNIILSIINGIFVNYDFDFVPNLVFGSLTGTFILAYIVLWVVLPEARSQYEKMEMRGEKVDVNTIRQTVKDRAKEFSEEVKTAAQNIGSKASEFAQTKGKAFAAEAGEAVKRTGSGLGHAIGVLFKVFFMIVAGAIAFGLFVALMVLIFGGVAWWPINNFLWANDMQQLYAWGTLIFFLVVPFVAFFIWLIRRMMNVKRSKGHYLGWIFGGLWLIGWFCAIAFGLSVAREIRTYEKVENDIEITQPVYGKLIVKVNEPQVRYTGNIWWMDTEGEGFDLTEDTLRYSNIRIRISKSEDSLYHTKLSKYSAGRNLRQAQDRASKAKYNVSYQDSILNLGSGLSIYREDKFRGQGIIVDIYVPEGKKIRFDESIIHNLDHGVIRRYERRDYRRRYARYDWDVDWNWDEHFEWDTNTDYTMGSDGILFNPLKPAVQKPESDYRYNEKENLRKNIEERERMLEEERHKIEEDKKKLGDTTLSSSGTKSESMEDIEEVGSNTIGIPGFSLVNSLLQRG